MSAFYFSRKRSKAPAEEKNFKLKSIGAAQKFYNRTSATPTLASITHRLYEEKDDEREQSSTKD